MIVDPNTYKEVDGAYYSKMSGPEALPVPHLYDQANLVMAFVFLKDYENAQKAMKGLLKGFRNPTLSPTGGPNYFYDYYNPAGENKGGTITLGDQAEALNALNLFLRLAKEKGKATEFNKDYGFYKDVEKIRDCLFDQIEKSALTSQGYHTKPGGQTEYGYKMIGGSYGGYISSENAARYAIAKYNYGKATGAMASKGNGTENGPIRVDEQAKLDLLILLKNTYNDQANTFQTGPKDLDYAGDVVPLFVLAVDAMGVMNDPRFIEFATSKGYKNMHDMLTNAMNKYLRTRDSAPEGKIEYTGIEYREYILTFLEAAKVLEDPALIAHANERLKKGPQADYCVGGSCSPISKYMEVIGKGPENNPNPNHYNVYNVETNVETPRKSQQTCCR